MRIRFTQPERRLGLGWIAAIVVGWAVGFFVCEAVKSFVSTLNTDGLIIGGSIGIAQWLVLRHERVPMRWWVLLTMLAFGVGKAAGEVVALGLPSGIAHALTGAVIGLAVGAAQWLALRAPLRGAGWWVAASIAAWALGWTIIGTVEETAGGAVLFAYALGAIGAAVAGTITAFALIWLRPRDRDPQR